MLPPRLAICVLTVCLLVTAAHAALAEATLTGPAVGNVDHESAKIWVRPKQAGGVSIEVRDRDGLVVFENTTQALPANDLCVTWNVPRLNAATDYRYAIRFGEADEVAAESTFRTATDPETPAKTVLAFGSCASEKFPAVWERMATEGTEALFLCGDTPYIDNSDLAKNRARHRAFLGQKGLAELVRSRPVLGTWDDHDFGGNDSDGTKVDRETIRKVFMEYRPNGSFGENGHGIYTTFRRGPVEVFLIDARYFSQAEPSPVDPKKPTLLGRQQWEWLKRSLLASTAPFKVLVTGMVWHNKPNKEKDDWETYAHEREALFKFIGEEKITGVVLLGGDVHVSLRLEHDTAKSAGYPIPEYVVSPLHERVLPQLIPEGDPRLVWSAIEPNVFLRMEVDSTGTVPRLTATWVRMDGKRLHEHVLESPPGA
jgi:alkaline phosphatase D